MENDTLNITREKASFIRKETLLLHKRAPATRIASALSTVEIFATLFYGGFYSFNDDRNRLLISKAHGSFSLYPILFDSGIITYKDLEDIGKTGAVLGTIPDCNAPKIINNGGALGNGLGVGCGIAKAFKNLGKKGFVFVLIGDGECNEGAVWEAISFAGTHKLDNLIAIFDDNKKSMMGEQSGILNVFPITEKLNLFDWETYDIDGHDINSLYDSLSKATTEFNGRPKAIVANTIKGKGVTKLEEHPLCHVLTLNYAEIEEAIAKLEN
ncbi:MAG: 1-deoxy-D-xylulose-5-phosphate synthase N-terminal domain-containing protein [Lentisphaerota bacterium]